MLLVQAVMYKSIKRKINKEKRSFEQRKKKAI